MNKEERTKTLINNIKLNINEPNVYEFGLCVEQWKQILDYIEQLQQENKKYKEVIDKAKEIIMQPNIEIREYRSCDMDYVYINEQLLEVLNEVK